MHLSPGMLTDRYELTMLNAWVNDGSVHHRAVFETFARRLPDGRRYGLLAGLGRLLRLVEDFRFTEEEVGWLRGQEVVDDATAAYLRDFRFRGDVDAYPEGDLYFPGSPILTVAGTLGECIVLETLVLSVLNHDSAIASAAARMVTAAQGRPLMEMGSRRTHEVPTVGTVAHAFILAHGTEEDAFRSQVQAQGVDTTLLVDTFDIAEGIRTAVKVAGPDLGAIRIDSGDLAEESQKARALLDELGATGTRIVVTSDLDEYVISALQDAPIDGYGVGTRVVTGSGHPTASMVYKLVAVADRPGDDAPVRAVSKKSAAKVSVGGRKTARREYDGGLLVDEWFTVDGVDPHEPGLEPAVQVAAVRGGEVLHRPAIDEIRAHAVAALASLPEDVRSVSDGPPYLTVNVRGGQS